MRVCVVLLLLTVGSWAIPRERFFPYGQDNGDAQLRKDLDEASSPEVTLSVPIVFYDQVYSSIFVNSNGLMSFLTEIPSFFNVQFPLEYPILAPLYTDVDTRGTGVVYYRETEDAAVLQRASELIRRHFSSGSSFRARSVFIVTWEDVGHYDQATDEVNNFQVVIATDGEDSFAFFLYADGGIEWVQGEGKTQGLPDARAQAGLMSGDGRLYTLRGSGTDQVKNLDKWSNSGEPGLWMFHVGRTGAINNIMPPDIIPEETGDNSLTDSQTCVEGHTLCHSSASCVDYAAGFCCKCSNGFYGNGKNCLKDGIPLRVNGKVSGTLNGIALTAEDLQSYVVTADGRAYTALSRVPETLGYDLQLLSVFGSTIGWLFARTVRGTVNGYQLTGGIFNQTTEVEFPQTGHQVTIKQIYLGTDVFDQLRMEASLRGSVPTVPTGARVEIRDYEETFTRVSPGFLRAVSNVVFRMEGSELDNPVKMSHSVRFEECPYEPQNPELDTLRVRVARNFIVYDARERIVRYAMTNKVTPLEDEDPCKEGRKTCGAHSSCVVEQDNFRCVCNPGYEYLYTSSNGEETAQCIDTNECLEGIHNCDINAICINEPGEFSCRCKSGFEGDGVTCSKLRSCFDEPCHPDAECYEPQPGRPFCHCRTGYQGNGYVCAPTGAIPPSPPPPEEPQDSTDCRALNICDVHADCIYQPETDTYGCQCIEGYIGTGVNCISESDTCEVAANCSPFATCTLDETGSRYECRCSPGYIGDGYSCVDEALINGTYLGGNVDNTIPEPTCPLGFCYCPLGYSYDGQECREENVISEDTFPVPVCILGSCFCPQGYQETPDFSRCMPVSGGSHGPRGTTGPQRISCDVVNTCHPHAQCIYIGGTFRCQCNAGYEGDGIECSRTDFSCDEVDICDLHASCVYDENSLRHICICNDGYSGDGTICNSVDECTRNDDCDVNAQCVHDAIAQKYRCQCNEGYSGDGTACNSLDECVSVEDCDENAQCVHDAVAQKYRCQCNEGYSGDGHDCGPSEDAQCHIINTCPPEAQCVFYSLTNSFRCQCKPGYDGDGHQCVPSKLGCNLLHDCDRHADCLYDGVDGGFRCRCKQGFRGDGYVCRPLLSCEHNPSVCDLNALCITVDGSYQCQCREGFTGDGLTCTVAPRHEGNFLLVNHGMTTLRIPFSPSFDNRGRPIQIQPFQTAVGIDIDCQAGRVYWSDIAGKAIRSSHYDGTDQKTFLATDIGSPEGVAVDWLSRNIYWTDSTRDTVEVASLTTRLRYVLISESLVNPRGIAVHPGRGKLFWSDWNRAAPRLEWSNMDGTGRSVLQEQGLSLPNSLTIDTERDELCWADAGVKKIDCLSLATFFRRTVVAKEIYPFGLTHSPEYYYWTDWESKKIERVKRPNGEPADPIDVPFGGSGKLYGIVAVQTSCARHVSSPCQFENGLCPAGYLCLPNGYGGRSCVCGDSDDDSSGEPNICNDIL